MKTKLLIVILVALSLAACMPEFTTTTEPDEVQIPTDSNAPETNTAATETVPEPLGKLPAPSFESQTYMDETVGFALEYPAGWTVEETMLGERGSQVLLLSSPDIADLAILPEGATRVSVTVNQWDPKNDLAAFIANRKAAWEASGFTILEEEPVKLDLGLDAVRFVTQTPDGLTTAWLVAAVGEQYVTLAGEGDLALAQEMMRYLRPIGTQ
jgi:hypothetical protein